MTRQACRGSPTKMDSDFSSRFLKWRRYKQTEDKQKRNGRAKKAAPGIKSRRLRHDDDEAVVIVDVRGLDYHDELAHHRDIVSEREIS